MSQASTSRQPVRRNGKSYHVIDSPRINRRKYDVLEHLGHQHRPRLLLHDPHTGQFRVALLLEPDSSTVQHLASLRRLPQLGELPHILDIERSRTRTTVVVRWIKGIDLGHYLRLVDKRRVAAPTAYEAIRLIRGLAHALWQLHRNAQVVHADLKPENLIITRKSSRLVMVDFGSAWPIEKTADRLEGDGLSPVFAAPELQTGSMASAVAADQFSASVILYRLLTGEIPYAGLGGQAGRPGYLSEFSDSIVVPSKCSESIQLLPKSLIAQVDDLLCRALALRPEARYETTSAWLDAIEGIYLQLKLRTIDPSFGQSRWQRLLDKFVDSFDRRRRA